MIVWINTQNSAYRFTHFLFRYNMASIAVLIDHRTKRPKVFRGKLNTTFPFEKGKPVRILLTDGENEFFISNIKGYVHYGNRYWITDAHGIKFKLIMKHDLRGNEDQQRQSP